MSVTAFELRLGAHTERQKQAIQDLLDALTIVPLGQQEAAVAAEIRLDVEAHGNPIGMADYLIAGICLTRRAILLTRNRKHFERVAGLALANLEERP